MHVLASALALSVGAKSGLGVFSRHIHGTGVSWYYILLITIKL